MKLRQNVARVLCYLDLKLKFTFWWARRGFGRHFENLVKSGAVSGVVSLLEGWFLRNRTGYSWGYPVCRCIHHCHWAGPAPKENQSKVEVTHQHSWNSQPKCSPNYRTRQSKCYQCLSSQPRLHPRLLACAALLIFHLRPYMLPFRWSEEPWFSEPMVIQKPRFVDFLFELFSQCFCCLCFSSFGKVLCRKTARGFRAGLGSNPR